MIRAGADSDVIAAGALLGSAAGGAAGLVVMGLYWRKHIRATRSKAQGKVGHGIRAGYERNEAACRCI